MGQHEYVCQSCFHKKICPEYHPQTYSCVHHLDEADVAPREEVAREIFEIIEDECLAYPIQEGHPTILVDARCYNELKKKYTDAPDTNVGHKQKYTDCKHFVGCECFSGQTCDQYEEGSSNTMEEQPTDVVDVVRCKDCFYNKNDLCMMGENLGKENYDPNFFCGSGYREDGNGRDRQGGGDDL